jgi:2'-5' RNA ligase
MVVGRVFAAVPLPDEVRAALADRMRGLSIPGTPVMPENWHVTLRFLGLVDEVTYDRFLHGMSHVEGTGTFRIALEGMGAFPNGRNATVLWVGVGDGVKELTKLYGVVEGASVAAGLDPQERPFHPHLTLARVRPPEDVRRILDHEVKLTWRCDRVVVYLSSPGLGGAIYEPLETFSLKR